MRNREIRKAQGVLTFFSEWFWNFWLKGIWHCEYNRHEVLNGGMKVRNVVEMLTILQRDLASSENLLEYSSSTSLTSRSTSSLLIFFLRCWKGDWPSIISYRRQPSAHQSGLKVYRSFFTTSGATAGTHIHQKFWIRIRTFYWSWRKLTAKTHRDIKNIPYKV